MKVDGVKERARQDVYIKASKMDDMSVGEDHWTLRHVVIADYGTASIMEMEPVKDEWTCSITNFDKSLNLISNILRETWSPQRESGYTSYLGLQNTELGGPNQSYHGFKTFSSDDVEWSVFFNDATHLPQFAISGGPNIQTIIIKRFEARGSFTQEEFMPKLCYDQREIN